MLDVVSKRFYKKTPSIPACLVYQEGRLHEAIEQFKWCGRGSAYGDLSGRLPALDRIDEAGQAYSKSLTISSDNRE